VFPDVGKATVTVLRRCAVDSTGITTSDTAASTIPGVDGRASLAPTSDRIPSSVTSAASA
jgi:hypothetical protein